MKIYKKVVSTGFAHPAVLGTFSTVGSLATTLEIEAQCPKIEPIDGQMSPLLFVENWAPESKKKHE
ncbi:hypothetical protein [Neobacillus soli]|uniref:hypothetical protein n=1 Tax=Neobacillus soli TaxID=220688 RepID=UPI000824009E|nr:hypothetical protein [Neobacillus soli]